MVDALVAGRVDVVGVKENESNTLQVDDLVVGPHMVRGWLQRIKELEVALLGVRSFDSHIDNQHCWCFQHSTKCTTKHCVDARIALGMIP